MRIISTALVTVVLISLNVAAEAVPILDQNQPNHSIGVMHRFSTGGLVQSFQQDAGNIAGAGLWVSNYLSGWASATVTISLWASLADIGGTALASGSATHAGNGWVDVFWNPYSVTPGTTMYLLFESTNGAQGLGGSGNVYASGNLFAQSTPTAVYDFSFRTYTDPNAVPVPEPDTYLLLLLGLAAMACTVRRRQTAAARRRI